ncbi:hypothetical protein NP233_g1925 [Leucocoprinus birnbaumii]|uniref:G domain-containing protein n=1 Tax=Leucocoprinus birnbaumii TaxID=56174 RepID=A0AAD5YZ62_9AGAR|nr:hypothetical protein NP233_g1925 [Leucocoprinus birnbaumii]
MPPKPKRSGRSGHPPQSFQHGSPTRGQKEKKKVTSDQRPPESWPQSSKLRQPAGYQQLPLSPDQPPNPMIRHGKQQDDAYSPPIQSSVKLEGDKTIASQNIYLKPESIPQVHKAAEPRSSGAVPEPDIPANEHNEPATSSGIPRVPAYESESISQLKANKSTCDKELPRAVEEIQVPNLPAEHAGPQINRKEISAAQGPAPQVAQKRSDQLDESTTRPRPSTLLPEPRVDVAFVRNPPQMPGEFFPSNRDTKGQDSHREAQSTEASGRQGSSDARGGSSKLTKSRPSKGHSHIDDIRPFGQHRSDSTVERKESPLQTPPKVPSSFGEHQVPPSAPGGSPPIHGEPKSELLARRGSPECTPSYSQPTPGPEPELIVPDARDALELREDKPESYSQPLTFAPKPQFIVEPSRNVLKMPGGLIQTPSMENTDPQDFTSEVQSTEGTGWPKSSETHGKSSKPLASARDLQTADSSEPESLTHRQPDSGTDKNKPLPGDPSEFPGSVEEHAAPRDVQSEAPQTHGDPISDSTRARSNTYSPSSTSSLEAATDAVQRPPRKSQSLIVSQIPAQPESEPSETSSLRDIRNNAPDLAESEQESRSRTHNSEDRSIFKYLNSSINTLFGGFKKTRDPTWSSSHMASKDTLSNLSEHSVGSPEDPDNVSVGQLKENDTLIALMGPTGSGKSSFISKVAGRDIGVGHDLGSFTSDVRALRVRNPDTNKDIILVDTPGFDDTYKSDLEILQLISKWLEKTGVRNIRLRGVLYLHRITDNRMAGTPLKNLEIFEKICGPKWFSRVVLVTTMWDELGSENTEMGDAREDELKNDFWKGMRVGLEHPPARTQNLGEASTRG